MPLWQLTTPETQATGAPWFSVKAMTVDAHLDLAHNALDLGRDLTLSLGELRKIDSRADIPTVTIPALCDGNVAVVFGTLWVDPKKFTDPESAHKHALKQLDVYRRWQDQGLIRLVDSREGLEAHLSRWQQDRVPGLIVLIEGAEPIRTPEEVSFWRNQGVRLVALAWTKSRYAGGTGNPGGLTELGGELLQAMTDSNMALDTSHLAEQSFWEALEIWKGPVSASHSNPRTLVPTDRHLTDEMIAELGKRNGVIGIVPFNKFLQPGWERGQARLSLDVPKKHLEYLANRVGWDKVGIGSDMDGGFGLNELPAGLDEPRDLIKVVQGAPLEARELVLGENWLRWLRSWL